MENGSRASFTLGKRGQLKARHNNKYRQVLWLFSFNKPSVQTFIHTVGNLYFHFPTYHYDLIGSIAPSQSQLPQGRPLCRQRKAHEASEGNYR